jgi:hypothetical protein
VCCNSHSASKPFRPNAVAASYPNFWQSTSNTPSCF